MLRINPNTAIVRRPALRAVVLLLVVMTGCRQFAVPRIDPTGERLFAPGTTTIDPQLGHFPTPPPAFVTPAAPPTCPTGQPGCKSPFHLTSCQKLLDGLSKECQPVGDEGQLILTPARIVAPVGTEVVLLAGLCGPKRTFVARQPIEWVMSQESVGNFVAVGEDGESSLVRLYRSQPKKTDSGYAVGLSSAHDQVVTRGTPSPADDLRLGKGQAWISVTSPSEGTSYVTVLAPKATNWDQRRQTAVIHWVDAQWSMPGPAIVPAGRKHTLVTNVRRAGGATPATGWIVRYEVAGGEPAVFAGGKSVAEVPVDAQGNAAVEIAQPPGAALAGTTSVGIQILRPGLTGAVGSTVVGNGATTITWSAPGLAVKVEGPQVVQVGLENAYRITVSNPGDIASRGVVVDTALPPGLQLVDASLPPQVTGNRLQWQLGDLAPQSQRAIDLKALADRGGDIRWNVRAQSADGVSAAGELAARITRPSLQVTLDGPKTANLDEKVQFQARVTNVGDQPLTNVRITNRFDRGLVHVEGHPSPIVASPGDLQPGQSIPFAITFITREAGERCHTLEVTADGGELATQRGCVRVGMTAAPAISVDKTGPTQAVVGESVTYNMDVRNTGNVPLTNVRIVDQYTNNLQPSRASDSHEAIGGALQWSIVRLAPGEVVRRQVVCTCMKAGAAVNKVSVTTNEQANGVDEVQTQIAEPRAAGFGPDRDAAAASPPAAPADTERGNVNADGKLSLSITASAETVQVGQKLSYFITLANDRAVGDREAALKITLAEGLQFAKWNGRYPVTVSADKRTIELTPIKELRPQEVLPSFQLDVVPLTPGKKAVRAEAKSERSPTVVPADIETNVFPKP